MSEWERILPKPSSKFLRVKCPDCGNEQTLFSHATNSVYCNVCGAILAKPTGGKVEVKGEIIAVLD